MIRKIAFVILMIGLLVPQTVLARPAPFSFDMTFWREAGDPQLLCFDEDDGAGWNGLGTVSSGWSFSHPIDFCESPGGEAFKLIIRAPAGFSSVIVSPTGLSWPITVTKDGGNYIHYACVGDDHGVIDGVKSGTIEPGIWHINVSFSGKRSAYLDRLSITVGMEINNGSCVF